MARRIALLAALAPLVLPAFAGAATPSRFFAGTPVDGPSADIQSLGDLDVARDGTGALAYVKRVAGVDHIFVSRLANGAFQPPEQIDAGLAGAGSQPVVAASDGGRLVVAYVSGGGIFTTVRAAGAPGYSATQQIAASGENPAVDMSINGVAYLTWSTSGDVLAARMERAATAFNGVPGPLDIDPAAVAGTGTGRPKVAVAADGIATVVWGEGGDAYARRIFELRLSTAPQDLGAGADEADISGEDDSSFAWTVFRQGGQTDRAAARRLAVRRPGRAAGRRGLRGAAGGHQRPRRSATRAWPARRRRARMAPCSRTTSSTRACCSAEALRRRHPYRRWPRPATASSPSSRATRAADAGSSRARTTTCPRREQSPSRGPRPLSRTRRSD